MNGSVQCPACGKQYPWRPHLAGRPVQCTGCGHAFRVPNAPLGGPEPGGLSPLGGTGAHNLFDELLAGPPSPGSPLQTAGRRGPKINILVLAGAAGGLLLIVMAAVAISLLTRPARPVAEAPAVALPQQPAPQPASHSTPGMPPMTSDQPGRPPASPGMPAPAPPASRPRNPLAGSGIGNPSARHTPPSRPSVPALGQGFADTTAAAELIWSAEVDPPKEIFQPFEGKKISAPPVPAGARLVSPATPSPFIAIVARPGFRSKQWACGVIDLRTGKPSRQCALELESDSRLALSPDGKLLASSTQFGGKGLMIWSLEKGEFLRAVAVHDGNITYAGFAAPDRLIVVEQAGGKLVMTVEDPRGDTLVQNGVDAQGLWGDTAVALSPGGRYLAVGFAGALHVYDPMTGEVVGHSAATGDNPHERRTASGIAFSPDGAQIAATMGDRENVQICCWDAATGELLLEKQPENLFSERHGFDLYHGPQLAWIPDKSGWLFKGRVLLDRQTGQPIWVLPETGPAERVLIDSERILILPNRSLTGRGNPELTVATLPVDKLAQAKQAVAEGKSSVDAGLPPLTEADVSQPQIAAIGANADRCSLPPDPAPPLTKAADMVSLGQSAADPRAIRFCRQGNRLTVLRHLQTGPQDRRQTATGGNLLESYSFPGGKRQKMFELPAVYELVDVSEDGNLALLGFQFGAFSNPERLDVWAFEQGKHAVGWRPYGAQDDPKARGVRWASFIGKAHVLTINESGALALWKLPECRAVYVAEGIEQVLALSPTGKYLAVKHRNEKTIRLLESMTGTDCGTLQEPTRSLFGIQTAAFRPDGQGLAVCTYDLVFLWDLDGGTLQAEFPAIIGHGGGMRWFGNRYLLAGSGFGMRLLDLQKQFPVWSYQFQLVHPVLGSPDGRLWYCAGQTSFKSRSHRLIAVTVPHEQAKIRSEAAPLEDLAIVYPGATVSITASLPGVDSGRLVAALTRRFEQNGVTVAEGAATRVSLTGAETTTGATLETRSHDPREGRREQFAQGQIQYTLRITDSRGRTREHQGSVSMRGFGSVSAGNAQQQLTQEMREGAVQAAESLWIPKYVFPNELDNGFGQSTLGVQGETVEPPRPAAK